MHPPRAAIERHVECRGIGEAAAADLARSFHHDHPAVRGHDATRRGYAGRTCANHDNIGLAWQRRRTGARADCRCNRKARRRREKGAARDCHVMVSGTLKIRGTSSELAASRRARQPSW
jgi:hypothetical protein